MGDCTPPVFGLIGVIDYAGKIHDGERPGHAVSSLKLLIHGFLYFIGSLCCFCGFSA